MVQEAGHVKGATGIEDVGGRRTTGGSLAADVAAAPGRRTALLPLGGVDGAP